MVTLIIKFAIVLLCCILAGVSATRYANKHNIRIKDVLPFWPSIFYGCGVIATARFIDYLFEYLGL